MATLTIIDHPLLQAKMAILRDSSTGGKQFRELVEEISTLIFYEAMRDAPLRDITVETPICKTTCKTLADKYAALPILRSGSGMLSAVTNLMPNIKVGHIGIIRDPFTLLPAENYCKLPKDCAERKTFILHPMLATGATASTAAGYLKQSGVTRIKLMCLLCSPEGVARMENDHPDVDIFAAALDHGLNSQGYIVPGVGDAGDRLYGTL